MKLSNQEKAIEETIRNLSGATIEDVDKILKALMYLTVMQFSENELIRIPYFGAFKIEYVGDEITNEGKIAKLNTLYFPSNEVKLNLGKWKDLVEKGGNAEDIPIIKDLMKNMKFRLNCVVNEEILKGE